ncbi:hypothetical protein KBC75_05150 [Candidatus Shapirobacteria bacterium]|nr:hypothetical protein [Candidatus Shapirobacteria bacterium]
MNISANKIEFATSVLEFNKLEITCNQSRLYGDVQATLATPFMRVDIEEDPDVGLTFHLIQGQKKGVVDAHINHHGGDFQILTLNEIEGDSTIAHGKVVKNLHEGSDFTIVAGPSKKRFTFILEAITN